MGHHLTPLEARLLLASAFLVFLLVVGLVFYFMHKLFKQSRETTDFGPKTPRAEDETGFAMAAMQGVRPVRLFPLATRRQWGRQECLPH